MRQASNTSGTSADISRKMLRIAAPRVKPASPGKPLPRREICPCRAPAADCASARKAASVPLTLTLLALAALAAGLALVLRRRGGGRRQQALAGLLDAADALEERLRAARAEIEAVAGSDDNPVREAMQEMLRQRLWLQQHGDRASLEQLAAVRQSIDAARARIDQQLLRIERARAPLH